MFLTRNATTHTMTQSETPADHSGGSSLSDFIWFVGLVLGLIFLAQAVRANKVLLSILLVGPLLVTLFLTYPWLSDFLINL
jgi:hypothetical protein